LENSRKPKARWVELTNSGARATRELIYYESVLWIQEVKRRPLFGLFLATERCLLAPPSSLEVRRIKVATLDSVITFQDLASLIAAVAPGKVLITGEDRFLGYSLMCGARAALIGMVAACTALQAALVHSFRSGQADEFLRLSRLVDDLARHTFRAPMEGYIQRISRFAMHRGSKIERAIHRLYFDPADGFILWATHAARRLGHIAPGSGTIRSLDLARRGVSSR